MNVREALTVARDPKFWRGVASHLRVTDHARDVPALASRDAIDHSRDSIRARGYGVLDRVVPHDACDALAEGLRSLQNAMIPAPFLFVFDEPWELAQSLGATFDGLLDARARLLRDVWAWRIEATSGARGWKPHRGVAWDVRDARGAPTLLNAWVALTDVGVESACMHLVPLDRDPHFPSVLDRIDVDTSLAVALPVAAGTLLAWNANVLHWGGAMSAGAPARASLSFSIRSTGNEASIDPRALAFDARVDLVADMIATYANVEAVPEPWNEWARLDLGMRAHARR